MSIEAAVLRAMLRVARRCEQADDEALAVRVGGEAGSVRAALRRLDAAGLVERRSGRAPRLTMAGLAVAVGLLPQSKSRQPRARPAGRSSRAA
jgi:Mn-dependent DtxR family transcriptional regulator